MCGILGGWWRNEPVQLEERLSAVLCTLSHRGPDDHGVEIHRRPEGTVALGHTRLSIIDLSPAGHQPMHSNDGRYSIVFNGEIYNYPELRQELKGLGQNFSSESDTEVLLAAWHTWGEACLKRLIGMFSFIVYDQKKGTLTGVRDAFGIKPFFYSYDNGRFLFASEMPALLALLGEQPKLDWQRSYDYLVFGDYDSGERTCIEGVRHLLPGNILQLDIIKGKLSTPCPWWSPNIEQLSTLKFTDAAEKLRDLFLNSVRLHLRSDVPLGAAISGGVDSSAIVCAIRHLEPDLPIHTFSYIARGSSLDEERWVDKINSYIGAKPHKVLVNPEEMAVDLDDMIRAQGEPFGSTSIYAQYRVFRLARENGITVTLEGQGADELIAGYHGYPAYRMLSLLEKGEIGELFSFANNWTKWPGRSAQSPWKAMIGQLLPEYLYQYAMNYFGIHRLPAWLDGDMLIDGGVRLGLTRPIKAKAGRGRRLTEMLARSLTLKGLPALLRHSDRNAMHFSVESRVPFLTIPIAEFLLALPEEYLISKQGETKAIFRAAMRDIVPNDVLDRRDKIGFATPERNWLTILSNNVFKWLLASTDVPFLKKDILLSEFNKLISGKATFSFVAWRWIAFCRWAQISIQSGTTKT